MPVLHVEIRNKKATYLRRDGDVICGNGDYVIQFTFDDEWDEFPVKTVRFITPTGFQDFVFDEDSVAVPVMHNLESFQVGVFAGNLVTTTPAVIPCQKSILCQGGVPDDPATDVYTQIMEMLGRMEGLTRPLIGEVTLTAEGWVGEGNLFSQVVNLEGVTEKSQVDLTPSVEQLAEFHEKDLAFVTENEDGVVTVYAIGQRPQNDHVIQVTITEVSV